MTQPDPEAIYRSVIACPGVSQMSQSPLDTNPYSPGQHLTGVKLLNDKVELHLIAKWGFNLVKLGNEVISCVKPLVYDKEIEVYIDDIELPGKGDV